MSKRSKNIISASLLGLMETELFKDITISEICDHTTLVRKTFYNNFNSKEDVILYIVKGLVCEYLELLQEINVYMPLEMSYLFFCFAKEHSNTMTMFFENKLFYLFVTEFEKNLSKINALVKHNKLNILQEDELEYVFAFHTTGVIRMLELWIEHNFNKTPREMSHIYHTITLGMPSE